MADSKLANLLRNDNAWKGDADLAAFNQFEAQAEPWYNKALPMEGRTILAPIRNTMEGSVFNQKEWALPAPVAWAVNALTAGNRAYTGADPTFNPQEEAASFANGIMGGGMGASKVTPPPSGSIGMFIGPSSKKWDELAPKVIGPDQLLRQELSDQAASVKGTGKFGDIVMNEFNKNNDVIMKNQGGEILLKDVFNHPEVFEAYPALQDYKVRLLKEGQPLKGRKGTDLTIGIRSDLDPKEAKSTILHEMQHHIQEDEGFAQGGSARVFFKDLMEQHNKYNNQINQLNTEMRAASGTPKYENLLDEKLRLIKEAQNLGVLYPEQVERQALHKYTRLGGEAEARLTQARMDMTPAERLAQNPFDPEVFKKATGISLEDVILQGNRKDQLRQQIDKLPE